MQGGDISHESNREPVVGPRQSGERLARESVSEYKETLEKLRASELLFKLASEATRNVIWDYNPIADTKAWNEAITTEFGYPITDEMQTKDWWLSRIHPEDIDRVNHILGEVLISKVEKLSGEYRFRKADGTYAVVIDRATLLYDEQRMLIRMIGVMEDVTAERMATAYLRESEQRWRTLSNSMSQIAWTSDFKGAVTWFNDRYYQFTGRRENETLGSLWHSVIHPDYRGFVTSSIDYHTRAEAAWEETFPMLSRAGEYRYFLATSHPIRDEEGLITMWLGTATDVTRQIELTNQIREREEHLRIATESANIGTWTMDLTSRQGVWSKRAAAIHGFPERVNFTTDEAEDLVHPEDRHILEKVNSEAFHSTQTFFIDIELRIIRPDGSVRWVALAAKKLEELNPKGGPRVFLVGTLLDLTERVLAQEELRKAKEEAESANAAKSSFLANMSHEIRTPLGAILGFANLLREERYTHEERVEFIDTITRAGLSLTRIIDDILDLSKIEAGAIKLETVKFSLHELIHECATLFRETARSKGLTIGVAISRMVPSVIGSDAARIRQILINLIGNAVKFTKAGSVQIDAFTVPVRRGKGSVDIQIDVKDTGIGITAADRKRIFQPFTQIDDSTTRSYGGTGLGLALSKRLALALGGDINVGSASPDHPGCTFSVMFPALVPTACEELENVPSLVASQENERIDLQGISVLVAEDSPEIRFLLDNILSGAGAKVSLAENGQEAIDKVKAQAFDVILMDIQMPCVDGYQATKAIRASGFTKAIIAVTAHAMAEERERTRQAGCDFHLTKPLDPAHLLTTIQRSVRGR